MAILPHELGHASTLTLRKLIHSNLVPAVHVVDRTGSPLITGDALEVAESCYSYLRVLSFDDDPRIQTIKVDFKKKES